MLGFFLHVPEASVKFGPTGIVLPARKRDRTGKRVGVCLLSPGMHLNDKPVCQSPLLRNPLQVERHQGPGCGGCIFLFIIDDPDPDRQHTTHVIWIHFGFRCMPSSGLDSEPSLCAEGGTREVLLHVRARACVSV